MKNSNLRNNNCIKSVIKNYS